MSHRGKLHDPSGGQVFFPEEIVRPDDLGVEEKPNSFPEEIVRPDDLGVEEKPDCPPSPETKVIVVEKIVPGPERVVEKIVPGPERVVEITKVVEKIVPGPERIVEKIVPGPERIVEKLVPGPERIVEKIVPGPERVVEKIVPGPERVVEKIVPTTSSSHGGNISWEQYLTSGAPINWNNADARYHANRLGINIPGGPSPCGGAGGRWRMNACGHWERMSE